MPKKKKNNQQLRLLHESEAAYLPSFTSSEDEIKRAVERNAIARGVLLIKVIISLKIDELLKTIELISRIYDKEDLIQAATELNIDLIALEFLDKADPPIPYPYYFCIPEWLIDHPNLLFYYRNVAMLSSKVMNGIGLSTTVYEVNGLTPESDYAIEVSRYLNGIVSSLVKIGGVSQTRHIEMLFGNLGDSLGGISRNEVGRAASAQVIRYIATHMHKTGKLKRIVYSLKGDLEEDEEGKQKPGSEYTLNISTDEDIEQILLNLESQRVKYRELLFDNGYSLLLDRQIKWQKNQFLATEGGIFEDETEESLEEEGADDNQQGTYKIGVDLQSTNDNSFSMKWAAELKGGVDPAGSDEHWKTATQALNRVRTASRRTGRNVPPLSFIATILVERVAREALQWLETGKLKSVYNLTKIEENEDHKQQFLADVEEFVGYSKD